MGNSIIEHCYTFRVKYHDTDKMGTVHHSNYVKYYETARWELFRALGISYRYIEEAGYLLPVIRMEFHCLKKAQYDTQLTVKTILKAIKGVRIWFSYQIFNEHNELINEAETELAFVDTHSWKPIAPPPFLREAIERYTGCNVPNGK